MMRLVLVLALVFAAPAGAQPRLEDPEANIVEELVVQAIEPGPPWWRVQDADTTVWIMAVGVDVIPSDMSWNKTYLQRRLTGANILILGSRVAISGGLFDIPAALRMRKKLRSKAPMEQTLPEPLRARFVAARERLGQPAERYDDWGPIAAGMQLLSDSNKGKKTVSVTDQVLKEARARKVKTVTPGRYKAKPMLRTVMAALNPATGEICMDGALDDVEAPPGRDRAAARGWALGDVGAALTEPRGFEKCVLLLAGGPAFWREFIDDQADAVQTALKTPGHAVAVMSLRQLLAEDGVIEQLEAKGIHVAGPGEAL
jgi:hypothetical protein